jgi:hypothetical protein
MRLQAQILVLRFNCSRNALAPLEETRPRSDSVQTVPGLTDALIANFIGEHVFEVTRVLK